MTQPATESTNKKIRRGLETANTLLTIARHAFARQGYAATTTQEIIAEAKVTKGALYHHFPSKVLLFEAVYRAIEREMAQRIDNASGAVDDPWEKLVQGCNAYLEACLDENWHRILRIDGPAVLGHDTWMTIDREHGLARLLPFLEHLADTGVIRVPSVEAFARQLTGAMNEATFWIAEHEQPEQALAESRATLQLMLQSIKAS